MQDADWGLQVWRTLFPAAIRIGRMVDCDVFKQKLGDLIELTNSTVTIAESDFDLKA